MAKGDRTMASHGEGGGSSRSGTWVRGKYHLDRELGDGGMAVVYAATHRNKKRFAVKMLRPELSTVIDVRNRFLREGYVANTVEHPGVVAVLDDDVTEDGCAFLVMELLEGESVDRLAEREGGKLDVRVVLAIAHQLLDVLVSAHAKNVVHRDLKPGNLFATRTGQVKVLDFGIARLREAHLSNATNTGMAMGTPAFMGPEQARGKSSLIGPKTDLWAVGATMFSLLTNLNVHEGESAQEVVFHAGTLPARSLATVLPGANPDVVGVVDRALAFDQADRWADAGAMRDAIAVVYEGLYGRAISGDSIATLLGERVRIEASQPELNASRDSAVNAPTIAVAPPEENPIAIGRTTEQPVSAGHASQPATPRRGIVPFVAVGAVALVGIGIAVVVTSARGPSNTTTAAIADGTSPKPIASASATELPTSTATPSASIATTSSATITTTIATATRPPIAKTSTARPPRSSDFDRR